MRKIRFQYLVPLPELKNRKIVSAFIERAISREGFKPGEITVVFCSDEYLLALNQQHLEHDYYTDIITFQWNDEGQPLAGELYISADRTRDNAKRLGVTRQEEVLRVIFHGMLHLCGYKDKLKADQELMRLKEDEWLVRYFKIKRST